MPNKKPPQLIIKTLVVSPYQQNARIITDTKTQKSAIIDPGADCEKILLEADPALYPVESIFLTHCHIDHCGGVTRLLSLLNTQFHQNPTLYYHSADTPLAEAIDRLGQERGWGPHCVSPKKPDVDLATVSTFKIGSTEATVLFTPGHAPGHCALFFEEITAQYQDLFQSQTIDGPLLLSGDALFRESIGRTDLPFGNFSELIDSIKTKFLPLPNTTVVLSGHGRVTTIGHEKNHNPFLTQLTA